MLRFKRHADVMAQAVLRSDGLLYQHSRGNLSARNIADNAGLVAVVSHAVAALDMQHLAGNVRALVASCQVAGDASCSPGNLGMLHEVHSWMVQQQLLDGRGLKGLLSEQQLAVGQAASEAFQAQQQQQQPPLRQQGQQAT
uniref:Uncharacterized protein n=1 Tax=Tetradesmus obliquus TaxID=3088 RepID=A0A383W394_TETOB